MGVVPSSGVGRGWPIAVLLAILAAVTCYVVITQAKADPSATDGGDANQVLVQHLAFLAMVGLFAWHQRRVLLFLLRLLGNNWIIACEIVLLLSIVYGAFGSFGVPELFWDDSPITVGVAAFSAAAFLALAWFAIYLVDESRPGRRRSRRLTWDRIEPVVVESGLPALLRLPTQGLSPRWQLGWFLAVATLPGLFLLALPAFLPAIRPSSDPRPVEWTWLAGLALGAAVPQVLLAARPISMLLRVIRSRRGRAPLPEPIGRDLPASGGLALAARTDLPRRPGRGPVPAHLGCPRGPDLPAPGHDRRLRRFFSVDSKSPSADLRRFS